MKEIKIEHKILIHDELKKALDAIGNIGELCAKEKYHHILLSTTSILGLINNVSRLTMGKDIDKSLIPNQDFTKN
ncbi:hypothetical protein [Cecembia rubra]|uniref:Uncharacterized protein n=1 Tax=Cecembia rubra TaxID=1485585 RepID=A0A2P8E346_9BACT|nr:hypothetical protein [Cecembia rubra]PSL03885.1 hypothetical protein CLV48_106125 [Cecembia rubra]